MRNIRFTILTAFMALGISGCSHRALSAYTGWSISAQPAPASLPLSRRVGHLLEDGTSIILHMSVFDPGGRFTIDDERCDSLLVEVPRDRVAQLPATLKNPVAYYRRCSCVWRICQEEAMQSGFVTVRKQVASGFQARVDLKFPSGGVRVDGTFQNGTPDQPLLVEIKTPH